MSLLFYFIAHAFCLLIFLSLFFRIFYPSYFFHAISSGSSTLPVFCFCFFFFSSFLKEFLSVMSFNHVRGFKPLLDNDESFLSTGISWPATVISFFNRALAFLYETFSEMMNGTGYWIIIDISIILRNFEPR